VRRDRNRLVVIAQVGWLSTEAAGAAAGADGAAFYGNTLLVQKQPATVLNSYIIS